MNSEDLDDGYDYGDDDDDDDDVGDDNNHDLLCLITQANSCRRS